MDITIAVTPSLNSDDYDLQKEMVILSPKTIIFHKEYTCNLLLPLGNRVVEIIVQTATCA